MEYIILNNGLKMPIAGLGTYMLSPDEAERSVTHALKNGYELIDTANAYQNERGVGRGMKASGKKREEIFLETKLWPAFYEEDDQIDKTLKRLDVDYIDLMILHQPSGNYLAGYKKLEKAYKEGKLKAIGISNFNEEEIENLLSNCEIKPALIQVEAHPYHNQFKFKEILDKDKIVLQSWYPLGGRGNSSILDEEIIVKLANKYHKSPAQIIMRWHSQVGYVVIPGSKTPSHIDENIQIFDFKLTDEEMELIKSLNKDQPFYIREEDRIAAFANWRPDLEAQK